MASTNHGRPGPLKALAILGIVITMLAIVLVLVDYWFALRIPQGAYAAVWGSLAAVGAVVASVWAGILLKWGILEAHGEQAMFFGGFAASVMLPPALTCALGIWQIVG